MHPVLAAWAPPAPFPALRADPVQLYPVAPHDKAEKTSDAFLQPLELLARELDDLPAALADDVIVLLLIVLHRLVARLPIVEVALGREPALLQQLEGAVHGRVSDTRIHAPHGCVELFHREMPLGAEEDARDVVALRRRFEAALAQRLLESSHAGAHGHGRERTSRRHRSGARAAGAAPGSRSTSRSRARRAARRGRGRAPPPAAR